MKTDFTSVSKCSRGAAEFVAQRGALGKVEEIAKRQRRDSYHINSSVTAWKAAQWLFAVPQNIRAAERRQSPARHSLSREFVTFLVSRKTRKFKKVTNSERSRMHKSGLTFGDETHRC
jgi:hypothetical protein